MDRLKLEVADVLRRYGEAYREVHRASLSTAQRRVMSAIELCRTAALGSHLEQCDQCRFERVCYDNRLLDIEDGHVQFRYKDYRHDSKQKTMTLPADEFIRRFLLHVLPDGFQRIRHYGFLGNRYRQRKLARCRQLLGMKSADAAAQPAESQKDYRDRYQELTGVSSGDVRSVALAT